MKAIITTKYGSHDVLQLRDMEKPTPKDNEVLIKVHAASITRADTMMRKGIPIYGRLFLGLTKPKHPIPGTGFSGAIEAVGNNVNLFQIGDEVFGETVLGAGTNAEYTCVPENGVLSLKPSNLTHEEVASICDGPLTSWNFLKVMAEVKSGQSVLINGASGSLGTASVQLAKHLSAKVTGVCGTSNVDMVKSLGADHVIDYSRTDFTEAGQTYDVIFDTVGKSSFSKCRKALKPNGVYLSPVLSLPLLFQMLCTSIFGSKKAKFSATGLKAVPKLRSLLNELKSLLESGQLKSVIDRCYSLEEVAEAHRYIDTGRKKGNVIVVT